MSCAVRPPCGDRSMCRRAGGRAHPPSPRTSSRNLPNPTCLWMHSTQVYVEVGCVTARVASITLPTLLDVVNALAPQSKAEAPKFLDDVRHVPTQEKTLSSRD